MMQFFPNPRANPFTGGSSSGGGPVVPLTPNLISGLAAWWDASDTATIAHSTNSVNTFADKSGNGNTMTVTGASSTRPITNTRTINELNVLDCDGVSDHLTIPTLGVTAYTEVFVCSMDDFTGGNPVFSNIRGDSMVWTGIGRNNWGFYVGALGYPNTVAQEALSGNTTTLINTPVIGVLTCDENGLTELWINGIYQGRAIRAHNANYTSYMMRYNTTYADGVFAEGAIYNRVLTIAEINALGMNFATKWAATWATAAAFNDNGLRIASLNNRIHIQKATSTGRANQAVRWAHIIAQDMTDFRISVNNTYSDSTDVEFSSLNDITIVDMSIEGPSGTVVPVYFNGSRTITLKGGVCNLHSDVILPSLFGGATFAKNDIYWIKAKISVANTAHFIPQSNAVSSDYSGQQVVYYDTAVTTASSTDASGVYTATGTAFTVITGGFTPILIGTPVNSAVPTYLMVGDSIVAGTGDSSTAGVGGRGYANRAMHGASDLTNPIPSLNVGVAGCTVQGMQIGGARWKNYIKYCNRAIEEGGTNDITVGIANAAIQSALLETWQILYRNGISKIIRPKYMPRTTTSNAWRDEATQTVSAGWGTGEAADLMNTWFDGKVTDLTINAILSTAAVRGVDTHKWITNGGTNYGTGDGIHPSFNTHILEAAPLRTVIATVN